MILRNHDIYGFMKKLISEKLPHNGGFSKNVTIQVNEKEEEYITYAIIISFL